MDQFEQTPEQAQ